MNVGDVVGQYINCGFIDIYFSLGVVGWWSTVLGNHFPRGCLG